MFNIYNVQKDKSNIDLLGMNQTLTHASWRRVYHTIDKEIKKKKGC